MAGKHRSARHAMARRRTGHMHHSSSRKGSYQWLGVGAVTLGIGAALANGTAVAAAGTDGDSASSSASASSSPKDTGGASTPRTGPGSEPSSVESAASTDSESIKTAPNSLGKGSDDAGSDEDSQALGTPDATDPDDPESASPEADLSRTALGAPKSASRPRTRHVAEPRVADIDATTDAVAALEHGEATSAEASQSVDVELPDPVEPARGIASTPTILEVDVTSGDAPVVTQFLSAARTSALVGPGATPVASNPLGDILAAFFRRIQVAFFNISPTAAPRQNELPVDGVLTGTVGATDPDGDPLAVTLTNGPSKGTVTVNVDGTFTYQPSEQLAFIGGTDSFTVTISETNSGDHVHGVQGLLANFVRTITGGTVRLDDGSSVQQTVTIMIVQGTPTYTVQGTESVTQRPPIGVTVGRDGRLWVSDGTSTVTVLNPDLTVDRTVTLDESIGLLALGPDGRIYATTATGVVTVDPNDGNAVSPFAAVAGATMLAVGVDGRVYVLASDRSLSVLDPDGTLIRTITGTGLGPIDVAVDAAGRIYITNSMFDTNYVLVINPDDTTRTIQLAEDPALFLVPAGIAVGADGLLYVASPGHGGRVTIVDPDNPPANMSDATSIDLDNGGGFMLAVGDDGRIYITNIYQNTVTAVAPTFIWP